jgi:uncharacterized damage-inducible protein DinB
MAYSVIEHLRYNAWANARIADIVSPLEDSIIYAERQSSFPSIARTLLHIWDAETIWRKRMEGESPAVFASADFRGDKSELLKGFVDSSRALLLFIESKSPDFLSTSYSYRNLKGDPFTDTIEETLFHVVNHGTYHRGQVITMLRESNVTKLLSTDLIHYLRSSR